MIIEFCLWANFWELNSFIMQSGPTISTGFYLSNAFLWPGISLLKTLNKFLEICFPSIRKIKIKTKIFIILTGIWASHNQRWATRGYLKKDLNFCVCGIRSTPKCRKFFIKLTGNPQIKIFGFGHPHCL
jgi:hypothetical protein